MLAKFLQVPLSERRSNGFMAISKRRFMEVFSMADTKQREAGYPKLLHSERKGVLH